MSMRRGRRWLCALLAPTLLLAALPVTAFARRTVAQKKQIARTRFEEAERMREALKGKPESARTRRDFTRVIDAYRRVYYTAPTSSKADVSALAVGDLMVEYGRAFEDTKSLTGSIGQYEFLRREYPGSRYRFEALFTMGQVYREDIGDNDKARETFNEFLKRYPGHELAEQARQALSEMAAEEKAAKNGRKAGKAEAKSESAKSGSRSEKQRKAGKAVAADAADDQGSEPGYAQPVSASVTGRRSHLPLVTGIRHWSTPDYTRIAIDLEEEVKYEAGRVPSPDRIFFDLHDTKLASELSGKTFEVGDGLLQKIRVAQFNATLTRVVLEVDTVAEYSAFLLPNPYRLIVDIHGKQPVKTAVAEAKPGSPAPDKRVEEKLTDAKRAEKESGEEKPADPAGKRAEPQPSSSSSSISAAKEGKAAPGKNEAGEKTVIASRIEPDATKELTEPNSAINRQLKSKENKSTAEPTSSPTVEVVSPRAVKPSKRKGKNAKAESESDAPEVRTAQPTASGDRSLIRALGLKIGKIVVDAGHGGHDTGTIGPNGLLEKDLVLDVAKRLGKLLESKLGAEVVFTRDDDTFIPLESRTAVANQHQADLFISVHANSSRDPKARGVETYYLNFTSNAEALEVAARENAVSQKSVFELQDLVKKIALKDKIEESREFASNVQNALFAGLAPKGAGMKNRGVKKAPFVVLIGANMPSILAEISFVSNPADEKRLKTAEYRQKIAEALYRGVARYASGLSGVKAAGKLAEATTANAR